MYLFIYSWKWNLFQHLRIIWNLGQQKVTVLLFILLLFLRILRLLDVNFNSLNWKIWNPKDLQITSSVLDMAGHGISVFLQPVLSRTPIMNIGLHLSKLILSVWSTGRKMGTAAGDSSRGRNFTGSPRARNRILWVLMQHPVLDWAASKACPFGVSSFPKAPGVPRSGWLVWRLLLLLLSRVFNPARDARAAPARTHGRTDGPRECL